jgi:hypothetical protein
LRQWVFVKSQERCGACGELIPEGTAAQEILLHGVKRKRYRGECCAGAAPPNLPASPVLSPVLKLDLSRIEALIPNRTRGALKSMAREHLPAEPESTLPASLPRSDVRDLRVARQTPIADSWSPHRND